MSTAIAENLSLKKKYANEAVPALKQRFEYININQIPTIEKVVLNIGCGRAVADRKMLEDAIYTLTQISGQKPVVTRAKKAISNFKLREGAQIGAKVTLRGTRMWEFLERLISIAIPRIRDFRGVPRKSFDGHGNYTLGIQENIVFLEIDRDKISKINGLDITICTTAKTNDEARALLEELGMPFRK